METTIEIIRCDSNHSDFVLLKDKLDRELLSMYKEAMEFYGPHNLLKDNTPSVVLYDKNIPVACGAYKYVAALEAVEIKRMYVEDEARGKGYSKKILLALETWAAEEGYKKAVLETGPVNVAAIHLYKNTGYTIIENYPPYVGLEDSICMSKKLS